MARPAYERVGLAFTEAYKAAGLRQSDVAEALGVDPAAVSRWSRGLQRIDLEYFPLIDDLCGKKRGYLLKKAGYVDDGSCDVLTAIDLDPRLDERGRRLMSTQYEVLVALAATSAATAAS